MTDGLRTKSLVDIVRTRLWLDDFCLRKRNNESKEQVRGGSVGLSNDGEQGSERVTKGSSSSESESEWIEGWRVEQELAEPETVLSSLRQERKEGVLEMPWMSRNVLSFSS